MVREESMENDRRAMGDEAVRNQLFESLKSSEPSVKSSPGRDPGDAIEQDSVRDPADLGESWEAA
jgi:hypothetical protein